MKRIERYAKADEESDVYDISAFLIAQFGKNDQMKDKISGKELMDCAINQLKEIQHLVGGGTVFIECEDKEVLTKFYNDNFFFRYGDRESATEGIRYLQMLRFI